MPTDSKNKVNPNPCPVCGCENVHLEHTPAGFIVSCSICFCTSEVSFTAPGAVDNWNTAFRRLNAAEAD